MPFYIEDEGIWAIGHSGWCNARKHPACMALKAALQYKMSQIWPQHVVSFHVAASGTH
jgi:hypothetical protein